MSNDSNEFQDILRSVIDENGAELLKDPYKMNAFLLDLAYEYGKYRKLITIVLQEDVGDIIFQARNKDSETKEQSLKKCLQRLKSETWLTESAMILAVNLLAKAVDLGCELPEYKEPESQKAAVPVPQPSPSVLSLVRSKPKSNVSVKVAANAEKSIIKGDISDVCGDITPYLTGVTSIGYKAFIGNFMLKRVIIPECVKTIMGKAFSWCVNLEEVRIPSRIEKIGERAFEKCYNLRQISIENSPKYVVTNGMLVDKEKKRVMRAMNADSNINMTIPRGIKSIAPYAFECSPANTVYIPSTIERINSNAFYDCYCLNAFDVSLGNFWFASYDGVLYTNEGMQLVRYPQGRTAPDYYINYGTVEVCDRAFMGAMNLEKVIFSSSARKIGSRAFQFCENLKSVTLPVSITSIGEMAFQGCKSLSIITIPVSIKEISDFVFSECHRLESITVPPMVDRIGHGAFLNCHRLERIVLQEGVCVIGNNAFKGCSDNLVIYARNNRFVEQYCKAHYIKCVAL